MRAIINLLRSAIWVSCAYGSPQTGDEMIVESQGPKYVHGFTLGGGVAHLVEEWKKSKGYDSVTSTGNYDGCYFKIIIREKRLYLNAISVNAHDNSRGFFVAEIPFGEIFTKKETFADWFTGDLFEFFGESLGHTEVKKMIRIYHFKAGELINVTVSETEHMKKVDPAGSEHPTAHPVSGSENG